MIEIFALNGLISATNYSNKTLTLKPSSPPLLPQKSIFFPHYFLIPHKMLWRLLESHKDRLSISLQILNKFKRVNYYFPLKLSENCKFGRIEVKWPKFTNNKFEIWRRSVRTYFAALQSHMEFFWLPLLLLVELFHKSLEQNRLKQNLNNSHSVFMSINPFHSK